MQLKNWNVIEDRNEIETIDHGIVKAFNEQHACEKVASRETICFTEYKHFLSRLRATQRD